MKRLPKICESKSNPVIGVSHRKLPLRLWMWADGTQQWGLLTGNLVIFLERVLCEGSRRPGWTIVSRERNVPHAGGKYPPKVAGPFENFALASTAYLLYVS